MSQTTTMLKMLRTAGQKGVSNYDFTNQRILRYSSRIAELRHDGYNILTERVQLDNGRYTNVFRYTLLTDQPKRSWLDKLRKDK